MGLLNFDGLFGNGPLSSPDAQYSLAAGLLGGRGNFGANLGAGVQAALAAGQQERANRANDLQQLQGLYKIALENDQLKAMDDQDAGRPHIPDPSLIALQTKMAQLSGLGTLSGVQNPGMTAPPPPMLSPQGMGASQGPAPMPGMAPASSSPMASPDYQPPQAQVQQRALANVQQQANDIQAQMVAMRRQGDRYAIMGFPTIAENRYKMGTPMLSRGVSVNPMTGLPIAGFVNNVPVQFDLQGHPTVVPSDIPQALASQEGQKVYATELARAPFTPITVPGANRVVFASQYAPGMNFNPFVTPAASGQAAPQPARTNAAPSDNGVARVDVTQPSRQSQYQGGGISGPDPVALAKAEAEGRGISEQYAKAYGEFRTDAAAAPQQLATLEELRQLANNALSGQTGAVAPFKQKLGEWMISAGVSPDNVNKTLNIDVPSAQEFVKLSLQRAMQQTRTMGAREAASVFQTVQSANPNMGLTTVGINKILAPLIAEQNWKSDKFNAADQWMAQKGTLAGFESQWNQGNSFSKYWQNAQKIPAQDPNALPSQRTAVTLPNGRTYHFPNAQAAQQFKQHAGIQ